MLKKLLRKPYSLLLEKITQDVLNKHNPKIIAVAGDGYTAIARELLYEVMKETYACRRSLESAEVEFSIPLTVLGYKKYPRNLFDWIYLLIKAYLGIKKQKPYSHFLILELNLVNEILLRKWIDILKPETFLIVGKVPLDYSEYNFKKVVKISGNPNEDILGFFKIGVRQIAKFYDIEEKIIESVFDRFKLPDSKIRFLTGKKGETVIDATHFYNEVAMNSVFELIDNTSKPNITVFTDNKNDLQFLKSLKNISINPQEYNFSTSDIIILRGYRKNVLEKFQDFL